MDGSSSSKRKPEAQREGESSTKRLNVTVGLEFLDCPICSEPLRPPIFQCSVGHFICEDCCEDRLDSKCHLCSVETSFERCFGMEHVVQSVTVACSNEKYGCAEKVTYYKKEEHKKACPYAPCFCPESGCGFAGPTKVLLDHFTTQHKCPSATLPDSGMLSVCLQPGLHVLKCTGNNYFFLLSMVTESFGHVILVVCVQPNWTESKFTCSMSYDCITTGCCGSTSWHIRSSSLSDGLPTVYDLILPKGKVSDDANSVMLRATIHHQPLSLSRSCFRGKGLTPALQQRPDTYNDGDDEEDNIPLSLSRSRLRGKTQTPAVQQRPNSMEYIDGEEEDEIPLALRRSHPADQRRPDTYDDDDEDDDDEAAAADDDDDANDDDAQQEEDELDDRPVSLSRHRIIRQRICLDTDDEEDEIPLALRRSHPAVQRSPDTYDDDAQEELDEYDDRPVSLSRPRIIRRRIYSDTDDEEDNIPLSASRARVR